MASQLERYQRISELIIPLITAESQRRLDATLSEVRARAMAQSKDAEDLNRRFGQGVIDQANQLLAIENAWRIRQWCQAILHEENEFNKEHQHRHQEAIHQLVQQLP